MAPNGQTLVPPWQQELLKTIDPEEAENRNRRRALLAASQALMSTPGNALQGLAQAAGTGAQAYHNEQDQFGDRRMAVLKALFDDKAAQKEAELKRLAAQFQMAQGVNADERANQQGGGSEAGLNLVYWKDKDGKLHAGQTYKGGGMKEVPVPEGAEWAPGVGYLDNGTGYVPYDKRAGVPADPQVVPKDLAGAERQREIGAGQGKAIVAAPGDLAAADEALRILDDIETDPNMDWGVGGTSIGNIIPGTPGRDFQNKVDYAKRGAFLTAIQQMRGLGALSNAEGEAATGAVTRMNTATSKEEFLSALRDYRHLVALGRERAAARLGTIAPAPEPSVAAPPSPQAPVVRKWNPQTGKLEGGSDAAPVQTPSPTPQYSEGQTAFNPQTGERLIFRNGQWQPQ